MIEVFDAGLKPATKGFTHKMVFAFIIIWFHYLFPHIHTTASYVRPAAQRTPICIITGSHGGLLTHKSHYQQGLNGPTTAD